MPIPMLCGKPRFLLWVHGSSASQSRVSLRAGFHHGRIVCHSSRRKGKLKLLVICQLLWASQLLPARGSPTLRDLKLHGGNVWQRSCQQLQKCRIISQRPFLLLSFDKTFGAWQEYCVSKASLLQFFCRRGSMEVCSLQPARRSLLVPLSQSQGRENSRHCWICADARLSCSRMHSTALKGNVFRGTAFTERGM